MATIIVYSKPSCPYCVSAKELLNKKGVHFTEVRVDLDEKALQYMIEKTGRRTVPQIIINDEAIGGFDDLYALDQKGQLDSKLKEQ